ncbi:MAG: MFS transporter [Flavobacteriales bacterium CG_4_10_14_0_2_um_filter_32_8]|nr:MAG: MFS transporter [Flavobacteriales bacterium CG_4_10_14_0_2_um_filter_32_8]PJB16515.1 MAG: MFS transporter [Flavobacteriales bacterium CG_4_9_14_3_um_filter_32_8]
MLKQGHTHPLNIVVIVAALGYFVDIYDLILFSIVRVPSLQEIGIAADEIKNAGVYLLNMQMIGMLLGGIVWGMLGDKKGRLSTLFLTILLYSLANIANGFVQTLNQYATLRIIAGFGLAGELGIGITLVSEVMTKETRAWGTSIVSGIGIIGAALAFWVSEWGWRESYWVGGVLGLLLLGLRLYIHESGMFNKLKESTAKRGDFLSLFRNREKFIKYLASIFVGVPVWFTIGVLVTFSKEFGEAIGVTGAVSPGKSIMYHYFGAALGSVITGYISQKLKSRKKALWIAIISLSFLSVWYFSASGYTPEFLYLILFILGIANGYWAVFVTVASEQFGTNIRSTATTTIPNFVRGATVPVLIWWKYMSESMGIIQSSMIVGATVIVLAIVAVFFLEESYGKDLDYLETE